MPDFILPYESDDYVMPEDQNQEMPEFIAPSTTPVEASQNLRDELADDVKKLTELVDDHVDDRLEEAKKLLKQGRGFIAGLKSQAAADWCDAARKFVEGN